MFTKLLKLILKLLAGVMFLAVATLAFFSWQAGQREVFNAPDVAPKTGRFVAAGDVQAFIQESGPANGQAVLFLHGTGAWSGNWRETLDLLSKQGFRAIAMDLPPFGYSQRPALAQYSKADQARRIAGVIESLKLDHVILVGHSFGGGPTVEAAMLIPKKIRALVLVDAALSISDSTPVQATPSPMLQALLEVRPLVHGVAATFLTNPLMTKHLVQAFVANTASVTPERVAIYQAPLNRRGSTEAISQWLPELLAPAASARSEDPRSYAVLTMPVVAIWGARDTITPLAQGERLAQISPNGKLSILPTAGHIPQIETPDEFNALLLQTLRNWQRKSDS